MSGTTLQVFQYIFAPFALVVALYMFRAAIKEPDWASKALMILMALYPLGKVLEFWKLGPDFAMWYMSDVSFVPIYAFGVFQYVVKGEQDSIMTRWVISASCVLILAVLVEVVELEVNPYTTGKSMVARGDWVDVGCYIASYILLLYLVYYSERRLALAKVASDEEEQRLRAREQERREEERERKRNTPKKASKGKRKHQHGRR